MKATHIGSCQACGCSQKLPNGKLSLHGYTTAWGFFSGICAGSKHLPFEVSCDLIKSTIERATALVADTHAEIESLLSTEGNKVWMNVYKPATWERGSKGEYIWKQVELTMETKTSREGDYSWSVFSYVNAEGRVEMVNAYKLDGSHLSASTMAEAVAYFNDRRIAKLQKDIVQMNEYIKWQQERVNNWTPGTLKAVK